MQATIIKSRDIWVYYNICNFSAWISHPGYSSSSNDYDFAIIKLSTPVTFNDRVIPVCLPSASTNYDSKVATVTGWGTLSSGGSQPSVLQKVILQDKDSTICYFLRLMWTPWPTPSAQALTPSTPPHRSPPTWSVLRTLGRAPARETAGAPWSRMRETITPLLVETKLN